MIAMSWWDRNVVEPGKLPLMLLFVAFVVTWVTVRAITRSIRAGNSRLHNVQTAGVHLHHSTPGIILLTIGAVAAIGLPPHEPWRGAAAVIIGVGVSLVFDEFAMILHLTDDYWQVEGRQSVEAIGLIAACLALAVVGFAPFGVNDVSSSELGLRYGVLGMVVVTFACVVICVMKGKYRLGLIAVFLPPVAIVGAVRLARPSSRWDRHHYVDRPERHRHAVERASSFDGRWDPMWRRIGDALAGPPNPTTGEPKP